MPSPEEMWMQMMARQRDPQLTAFGTIGTNQLVSFGGITGPVALGLAQLIGRDFNIPVTQLGLNNVAHTLNNPNFVNQQTGVRGDLNSDGHLGFYDIALALNAGAQGMRIA